MWQKSILLWNIFICIVKIHMYTGYMEDNFILLIFYIGSYIFCAIWNCWLLIISTIKLVLLFETYFQFQFFFFCSPVFTIFISFFVFFWNNNQTHERKMENWLNIIIIFLSTLSLSLFVRLKVFFFIPTPWILWNVTNLIFFNVCTKSCYEYVWLCSLSV